MKKYSNNDGNRNILIIILVLVIIALVAFIVIDKTDVLDYFKENKVVDKKEKSVDDKEVKEEPEIEYELAPNEGNTTNYIYKTNNEETRNIAVTSNYDEIQDKNSIINTYKCNNCTLSTNYLSLPSPSVHQIGEEGVFASDSSDATHSYIINSVTGKVYKTDYQALFSYDVGGNNSVYAIRVGDEKYRLLKSNNRYLNDVVYDYLPMSKGGSVGNLYSDSTLVVEKDNKMGSLDLKTNKYVLELDYDKVYFSPNKYVTVYKDNKSVIYNDKGKKILTIDDDYAFCYDDFIVVMNLADVEKNAYSEINTYKIKLVDYKNNVLTNEVTYKDTDMILPTKYSIMLNYIVKGNEYFDGEYGFSGPIGGLILVPDLANKSLTLKAQ